MAEPPDGRALERYWDALIGGEPVPAGELDPAPAAIVRRLAALGREPAPAPPYTARLEERLMSTIAPVVPSRSLPLTPVAPNGRVRAPGAVPRAGMTRRPGRWQRLLAQVAAALLLVLAAGGSYLVLGPGRDDRSTPGVIVAPTVSPEASPVPAVLVEKLAEVTFGAAVLPAPTAELYFWRWTLAPGTEGTFAPGRMPAGVRVDYVVAGAYHVRVDGPLQVVRAGEAGTAAEEIAPGTEVQLGPGDLVVFPEHDRGQTWGNSGSEPLVLLAATVLAAPLPEPPAGLSYEVLGTVAAHDLARAYSPGPGPWTVAMRRLTLPPGSSLPESIAAGSELLRVEAGTLAITRTGAPLPPSAPSGEEVEVLAGDTARVAPGVRAALRNPGSNPLVLLVLTVTAAGGVPATPSA